MATFTNQTKNSSVYTTPSKTLVGSITATAGQAMGLLLALTYSGGQTLVAGALPTYINQTKN